MSKKDLPVPRFALHERTGDARYAISNEGTGVALRDAAGIAAAVEDIHNTSSSNDWLLLGYVGTGIDELELKGVGSGGIAALAAQFKDDAVGYGLVRVVDVVDGNVETHRFAYIVWIGESVPAMKKAKIATKKSKITPLMKHYNVEIVASEKHEVAPDEVMGRIQDASGSRSRVQKTVHKPMRQSSSRSKMAHVPTASQGVAGADSGDIKAAIADVRSNNHESTWALAVLEKATGVKLLATGTGGITQMKERMGKDTVNFGLLRVMDRIDDTVQARFIYIEYVGSAVPPMLKARVTTLKGKMDETFSPYHFKIYGDSLDDLSEAEVTKGIAALKGGKLK